MSDDNLKTTSVCFIDVPVALKKAFDIKLLIMDQKRTMVGQKFMDYYVKTGIVPEVPK